MKRLLIVNADDYGRSVGVNAGIAEAHERGIVTSASLMVRWPAAEDAVAYAAEAPRLSVGLHVDLGEWVRDAGGWRTVYEVTPMIDRHAVQVELERQLEAFRELVAADPTHIDSHQHVHMREPAASACRDIAGRLGVPLRAAAPSIRHYGGFYGQDRDGNPLADAIRADALIAAIRSFGPGVTELGCHPGRDDELESRYVAERAREVETLCDPDVRRAIDEEHIELLSFSDWIALQKRGTVV